MTKPPCLPLSEQQHPRVLLKEEQFHPTCPKRKQSETSPPYPHAYLSLRSFEWGSVLHVPLGDPTPRSPVVHNGELRPDIFVIDNISVVADYCASCQLTQLPTRTRAHHLAVNGYIFPRSLE